MSKSGPQPRPVIEKLKPYIPGRSLESIERELGLTGIAKMNQNENVLGPSPRALEAIRKHAGGLSLYPEGPAPALRQSLAQHWRLPENWFLVGNGSDEVFRLLAECYLREGDRVVVPHPSFAGYVLVTELMGAEAQALPLRDWACDVEAMAALSRESSARIVFLCRPNSPTAAVFPQDDFNRAMSVVPATTLIVLDEAYAEFTDCGLDVAALVTEHPNLIVTRTFSKIYGLAGIRLGYGIMRPEVMEPLLRARDPFSVNSLAIHAGIAALADSDHVVRTAEMVRAGKSYLYGVFEGLGIDYVPSETNFILFHTVRPAAEVYAGLLQHGVLVRPCDSFGLHHSLRVTIGTEEQNERFAAALEREVRSEK